MDSRVWHCKGERMEGPPALHIAPFYQREPPPDPLPALILGGVAHGILRSRLLVTAEFKIRVEPLGGNETEVDLSALVLDV